jgi:hypothetical protein
MGLLCAYRWKCIASSHEGTIALILNHGASTSGHIFRHSVGYGNTYVLTCGQRASPVQSGKESLQLV